MTKINNLVSIAVLMLAMGWASCSESAPRTEIVTTSGSLSGNLSPHDSAIAAFKGISFAKAPIGDLRWRPPQAPEAWTGMLAATRAGAPCWQRLVPETSLYSRGQMEVGEDCLYLNVWSGARADSEKLAVMVWFHGGGNTSGHGASLIFDGTNLARKGVVVVTANYRLGPFGFLAHPALTAESSHNSSGNYALLDQIATLQWVHRNIEAFGGDPGRVTIFGQSAGALDVCLLMASPLAKGLFHGVIGHSGGCMRTPSHLDAPDEQSSAHGFGLAIAAKLGVEGTDEVAAAALRAFTPEAFMEGASAAQVPLSSPIIDGWVLPDAPRRIFAAGEHNRVPVIAGVMADEFRGLGANITEMAQADYEAQVKQRFPNDSEAVLAMYKNMAETSTAEALRKISTHSFFAWQSRTWATLVEAAGEDAYVYYFSHPTSVFSLYIPARKDFSVPGGTRGLGAYHSGDLAYAFNNVGLVGAEWQQWDYTLSDKISDYWVNFAKTGNPNGADVPAWPPYRRAVDEVQEFADRIFTTENPLREQLNLFDGIYLDLTD